MKTGFSKPHYTLYQILTELSTQFGYDLPTYKWPKPKKPVEIQRILVKSRRKQTK
jgi:hypothetical protein